MSLDIKEFEFDFGNNVKVEKSKDGKYYHVIDNGFVIALCPTQETALYVGKCIFNFKESR